MRIRKYKKCVRPWLRVYLCQCHGSGYFCLLCDVFNVCNYYSYKIKSNPLRNLIRTTFFHHVFKRFHFVSNYLLSFYLFIIFLEEIENEITELIFICVKWINLSFLNILNLQIILFYFFFSLRKQSLSFLFFFFFIFDRFFDNNFFGFVIVDWFEH